MVCHSPIFNVLLIDDDVHELALVKRILSVLTDADICVDHVRRCSEAITLLNRHDFDLVLLDNRLSKEISAKFSVPFIRSAFSRAEVAIISTDVSPDYLKHPEILGVDYIVDKADMIAFLRSQLDKAIQVEIYPEKRFLRRDSSPSSHA